MDECLILVDNSNVWSKGDSNETIDWTWRIDFGALLREVSNEHRIIKAILVGSTLPPKDSVWDAARARGFEVKTYERSFTGND
jgi:hypothetical protein